MRITITLARSSLVISSYDTRRREKIDIVTQTDATTQR
jgi:hypothetical protein